MHLSVPVPPASGTKHVSGEHDTTLAPGRRVVIRGRGNKPCEPMNTFLNFGFRYVAVA
jgi:hypothetical protein